MKVVMVTITKAVMMTTKMFVESMYSNTITVNHTKLVFRSRQHILNATEIL